MEAQDVATLTDMQRLIMRMPPDAQAYIADLVKKGDVVTKDEPYYSRIRFEPTITVDGSNNATYAFAQGQSVQAFNYGTNGQMTNAGFAAANTGYALGTLADTNLTTSTGKVTNGADLVFIEGISFIPTPGSDPVLTKLIIGDLSVQAGFNGDVSTYKLGSPLMWPGSAGLHGTANSKVQAPNVNDQVGVFFGSVSNGLPGAGDVQWMKDPIVWMPQPQADSQFALQVTLARAKSIVVNARVAGTNNIPTAFTPPATAGADGTYAEFIVRLHGAQIGPRSKNR